MDEHPTLQEAMNALGNTKSRVDEELTQMHETCLRYRQLEQAMQTQFKGLLPPIVGRAIDLAQKRYVDDCIRRVEQYNALFDERGE